MLHRSSFLHCPVFSFPIAHGHLKPMQSVAKKKKSLKQGFPCDSDKAYLPSAVNCCIAQHKWVLPVTSEVSTEIATKWFSGPTFILRDTSLELLALPFLASFLVSTVS